eukprot:UN24725
MQETDRITRLTTNFKSVECDFNKTHFQDALMQEILETTLSKVKVKVTQRWKDLKELGVLDELWDNFFPDTETLNLKQFLGVFEREDGGKLLDLCDGEQMLRNQIIDLEQCLQSNKDMLAATDLLLEEKTSYAEEKEKEGAALLKEVETLRTKIKNVESEQRLLKRDFDLVFATNKSVQKKMEKAEVENRGLRKTIIALANQMERIERENKEDCSSPSSQRSDVNSNKNAVKEILNNVQQHFPTNTREAQSQDYYENSQKNWGQEQTQPHMVWDPAVRSLVPIRTNVGRKQSKGKNRSNNSNNRRDSQDGGRSRLISPFPRRYTSSHIPRYRRKYEMSEIKRHMSQV